jgi:hypothetical protein
MISSVFLVLLCRNFRESMQRKGKNFSIHSVYSTPEQGHFKKLTENKPPNCKPFLWSRLADYPEIANVKKARKNRIPVQIGRSKLKMTLTFNLSKQRSPDGIHEQFPEGNFFLDFPPP